MSSGHIPTEEILKDIAETESEIVVLSREIIGLRMMSDRMSQFRADAKVQGVAERQEFIKKLNALLDQRPGRTVNDLFQEHKVQ